VRDAIARRLRHSDGSRSRWQVAGRTLRLGVVGGALLLAVTAVAASAARRTANSTTSSSTLTVAVQNVPATLDPAKTNNGGNNVTFASLTYDSLVYLAPNGTYSPDLATSWDYVGKKNEQFVIHLRSGVKFSDGTQMTAASVVNSIEYAKAGGSTAATYLTSLKSVKATGPLTVTLKFSTPRPDLPTVFDQNEMSGDIVGPTLLATPSSLGTQTDGAGPYMLDASKTVTGSSYVFVPNPDYWNQSLRRYASITLRVIADSNAELNAVQTGQADFMFGGAATQAKAAKSDGLAVYAAPYGWTALFIEDYAGKLVPALKNQKVRQAINYATDRPLLAKALFGSYAVPEDETSAPGYTGYDPKTANYFSHNIAKAKSLLKQAGFPKGFTMTVVSTPVENIEQETEALASQLSEVGITLKIHEDPTFASAITDWLSRKYPAFIGTFGTLPMSIEAPELFAPNATFNPFHNPQPVILPLVAKADELNGTAANKLYQKAEDQSLTQGLYDVLFLSDSLYFAKPGKISNVEVGPKYPGADFAPDVAFFTPPAH
jgi:ABC-type transport system substrate-binding protein